MEEVRHRGRPLKSGLGKSHLEHSPCLYHRHILCHLFSRGGTELLEFGEITVFRVRHQSREERVQVLSLSDIFSLEIV